MGKTPKLKHNLHNLRDDAAKVLNDIGLLTKQFAEAGSEKTGEMKDHVVDNFEEQLAALRERLDDLSVDLHKHAKTADKHVRTNPYAYIFGAMGLGVLLGKLLCPRSYR